MKTIIKLICVINTIFISLYAQNCPYIDYRNNGNGQPNSCANVSGTPMAPNFVGTPYATAFNGLSKTGNIRFVFTGIINAPPAIKRIWIGSTLSNVVAGPASVPEIVNGNTRVSYCFYGQNLPPSGVYSIEFVDPINNLVKSICGFDGSTNAQANPPTILTQPQSQSVCEGNTLTLYIQAQGSYGGTLSYQWKKNDVDILGANNSTYIKSNITNFDAGNYSCRIGESNGTFITSNTASIQVINCSSNTYMDACGASQVTTNNTNSWTSSWVDYDNDGWEDLYVMDKSGTNSCKLYKNNSGANLQLVTNSSLSNVISKAVNSAWADYDRDGLKDLYISNATGNPGFLFKNNGGGNFQRMATSGIDPNPQYAHGSVWCDFNLDGYSDLLVTNFFETRFHQLYKNNKDGSFSLLNNTAISYESNRSMAPILCDYDNDGDADVFIPNGNNTANSLYKNNGNFQFEKITTGDIVNDLFNSVAATWGDYDNDGWMDLFVCNASNQNNNLYKNNGNGSFSKITNLNLVNDGGHSHGGTWIDIDNDGDLDLFITNDQGPNFLYINDGNGNFSRIMDEAIATDLGLNCGQSWADYNKDGKLDVMISSHSNQTDHLYCGKSNNNKWVNIKLTGTASNPDAIGSIIKLKTGNKWQMRQVYPINGFGGQNSMNVNFGLGQSNIIDSITIKWPSGCIQTLENINPNQILNITEQQSNLINGFVFDDTNNNCLLDSNEVKLQSIKLKINQDNIKFTSNSSGQYYIRVPSGIYNITLDDNTMWNQNCPININLSTTNSSITLNIPLQKNQIGHDLQISIGRTAWRRGFTGKTILKIENKGTQDADNVIVNIQLPLQSSLKYMNKNYVQNGNNNYVCNLGKIKYGESEIIDMDDSLGLNVTIGDELSINTNITADGNDLNIDNNNCIYSERVVGAIDPNDISVFPKGDGENGFISKEQWLNYTIRFENIGNYKATFVRIENQIPSGLNLNSFEILLASHNYNFTLNEKGGLTIIFKEIDLPPSSENSIAANGFITYKIKPISNINSGDEIYNSAKIIFDYEDPVITNRVLNTIKFIGTGETETLKIYPNSASESTNININREAHKYTEPQYIESWNIYDYTGKNVLSGLGNKTSTIILNIEQLENGLYIIQAIDQNNQIYNGKLIKN